VSVTKAASTPSPGLYAIVAYSIILAIPRDFPLPEEIPLGPLTFEGKTAAIVLGAWWTTWIVMLIGLLMRAVWAYRLALAVFALHIVLTVANGIQWLVDSRPPALVAWQAGISFALVLVCADALAMAYLFERRAVFGRRENAIA
jgi:hypothetical protein